MFTKAFGAQISHNHESIALHCSPHSSKLSTPGSQFCFIFGSRCASRCLSSNGNLNLDASLDVDDDLLDDLGGGSQVNEALVDAHLVRVPGLGTLTAGGLAGLLELLVFSSPVFGKGAELNVR